MGKGFRILSSLSTARKLTAAAHPHIIALCFIAGSAITFGAQYGCTFAHYMFVFLSPVRRSPSALNADG